MAHIHDVFDAEPRYVIDSVTRAIVNKENSKEVIVQGDHNSERFAFEIPRYIDAHDMSLCNRVQVHFINIGPNTARVADVYPIDDLQIDPENTEQVICSWLISSRATTHAGSLNFILRFMCVNDEGKVEYSWSTTPYTNVIVSSSIVNSSEVVDHYASDILESWYHDLMSAGTEGVNIVEQAKNNAIAEINRHTSTFYRDSANAFKRTVTGKAVRVDDVSPIQHYAKVYARGKNLFDISKLSVMTGKIYISTVGSDYIEITSVSDYNGNGYQMSGKRLRELCPQLRVGHTYTVSANSEGEVKAMYLTQAQKLVMYGQSITVTETMLDSVVCFYGYSSVSDEPKTGVCRISNIQIEEGDTATEYESYIDPTNLTVTASGKNLVNVSNVVSDAQNQVINNGNGTVTVNTTATSSAVPIDGVTLQTLAPGLKAGETYTLSAKSTGQQKKIWLDSANVSWDFGSSKVVTQAMLNSVVFLYASGNSTTATVSNIQIELGNTVTPYEAYKNTLDHQPEEDGTCYVTSLSPTMTVSVDGGAIIDLEYNRDTNVVMGDVEEALDRIVAIQESLLGGVT